MSKSSDEFITVNLRLAEDDYRRLKLEALKKRVSLGALIRLRLKRSREATSL